MRRNKFQPKEYERVLKYLKGLGAGKHKVGADVLPGIKWLRYGPYEVRRLAHGRDAIFVKRNETWKEIVPENRVDEYLRNAMLAPGSDVPLARDSGYHVVQQRTVGISRRMVQRFVNKQEVAQLPRQQQPRIKQPGKPVEGKGYLELDLVEAKGKDIQQWVHVVVKNFYFITIIDRLTGWLEVEKTQRKDVKSVAPKIRSMLLKMQKVLKTKIRYIRSDAGSEFKSDTQEVFKELKIRSKFVSSGNRIENANRNFQRIFYQLLRMGRGSVIEVMHQAQGVFNNTKSRIIEMTPLEALQADEDVLRRRFKESRKKVAAYKAVPLSVGDKVRHLVTDVVGKHSKALGYKSYRGKHWSPSVFTVTDYNATTGKYYAGGYWRTRDKYLKVPGVDAESKKVAADRHGEMVRRRKEVVPKEIWDLIPK